MELLSARQSLANQRLSQVSADYLSIRTSVISSTPSSSPSLVRPSESFRQISVIQRVDTSVSDLDEVFDGDGESSVDTIPPPAPAPFQIYCDPTLEPVQKTMEDKKEEIENLKREIVRKTRAHPVERVVPLTVDRSVALAAELQENLFAVDRKVDSLITEHKNDMTDDAVKVARENQSRFFDEIIAKITALELKADEVKASVRESAIESIVNTSSANTSQNVQELLRSQSQLDAEKSLSVAKTRAQTKAKQVNNDIDRLHVDLVKIDIETWQSVADKDVHAGMSNVKVWEKKLEKIVALYREAEDILSAEGVLTRDVPEVAEAGKSLRALDTLFREVQHAVEYEDRSRELYTDSPASTEKVDYPVFEGRKDECLQDFLEQLDRAFAVNKVTREDKVRKLRKCLSGHALSLVPESLKEIETALQNLSDAFGDATQLMRHRIDSLKKLGKLPKNNAKGGNKSVVEWYLKLEVIVQGMMDLGEKTEDVDIQNVLYSVDVIRNIAAMFPETKGNQILEQSGVARARLSNVQTKIVNFRKSAQSWSLAMDMSAASDTATNDKQPRNGGGGLAAGSRGRGGGSGGDRAVPCLGHFNPSLVFFNPPQNYPDCRVCKVLEQRGDTHQIYDHHHSDWATGCPRFICMSTEERHDIARAAKFCLNCMDPKYKYAGPRDPSHKCAATGKTGGWNRSRDNRRNKFKCSQSGCQMHLWVCKKHREENKQTFQTLEKEIWSKYKLKLAYVFGTYLPRGQVTITDPVDRVVDSSSDDSVLEVDPPEPAAAPRVPEPGTTAPVTNCQHQQRLTTEEALGQLKSKLQVKKIQSKIQPISEGMPQFILGYTKGVNRPLLTLYDTGCLGVLFKEGVPEVELAPAVLKYKGPIYVNGVGNTSVKANDEYMCSVQLTDGSRAVLEGLTVNEITAALPVTSLVSAENILKNSDKSNKMLQSLKCYDQMGGNCDILLGIQYSNIFPKAVHHLDNGLTIYKLVIMSHDKKFNATIGGPHESFTVLANYFGSIPVFLAHLQTQLDNFNKFGPPKISYALMSKEDLMFAKQYNELNVDNYDEHSLQHILGDVSVPSDDEEEEDDDTIDEEDFQVSANDEVVTILSEEPPVKITCSECGAVDTLQEKVNVAKDDEDTFKLRSLQKAQDEGLSIDYRCPRCRSCADCRNSYETERVSIREEAEDLMIRDSVKINWDKKCIECYLPVRGDEEEFLTSNRPLAVKVLQQQCTRYNKDESTKEIIVKAFDKLLRNGHMVLWDNLDEEDQKLIESKPVNHWIVWRVVFKPSLTTPARPVFDGSAKTKVSPDGAAGGRCLNDLVVKGRVVTLNLTKMVLRFIVGKAAIQGDLKQFYASIKLLRDQWNLQRVLYKRNLDPDSPVMEAVIVTLIWGIKCVSAQSETAVIKLAEAVKEKNPRLAELLLHSRFVDDLGDSGDDVKKLQVLVDDADDLFEQVGLSCKGWTMSGRDPPDDVAEQGGLVSIGGMKWHSKLDFLEIPIPPLHFSKKFRGRLEIGTDVFDGHFIEDLEKFVPAKLTRKQILSKKASLFDVLGKLTPISSKLSFDLRKAIRETSSWDEAVSEQMRSKWIGNFLMLEKLRGIKFQRARMPENAVSDRMNLIICGDTAKDFVKICGVWARFPLDDGSFSCQHLISRSLLGDDESSIPKEELEALTMASNLGWIVRQMLEKWVDSYIVCSDSTISLSWVLSDKNRLSLFHRNRAVQIRRGTDLDKLYHVTTDANICDVGSRPDLVTTDDVGPQSKWEVGLEWMRGSVEDAVNDGILKPAKELAMNNEEEEHFLKGFIFEKSKEVLTRGHLTLPEKIEKARERGQVAGYIFNPAKFRFDKTVRVLSIVFRFLKSFKCRKGKISSSAHKFQMLTATYENEDDEKMVKKIVDSELKKDVGSYVPTTDEEVESVQYVHCLSHVQFGSENPGPTFSGNHHVLITDDDVSRSLEYLFRKATLEVKKFQKPEFLKKIAIENDGILFSRSRILDGQRLQIAPGFEDLEFLKSFKPFQNGFNLVCPVLDRFSAVSFSIAQYIHQKVFPHRGFESSYRFSLDFVNIIEGLRLFRELGEECVSCKKLRGKYLDYAMGPLPEENFTIAPPFYITQVDIFGPCHVYVPGHSHYLRNKKVVEAKIYVLVFACPITKCINLQVIENKSHDGIIDGINRMCCEVGVPKLVLTDQDSGIMKALDEVEVKLKDLQHVVYKEKGILFKTCPVSGHNYHGLCERKIQSIQDCLKRMEVDKMRLHATGYQTLMKLIENDVNNLPFGFTYGRHSDNSPLLKLVFPNLLRIGRNNHRALDGPVCVPKNPEELMKKIEKAYEVFYNLWNTALVPKLMKSPKWYDSKENFKIGDVVYFQKEENLLSSKWSVGQVADVVLSKDGKVRRVQVEYQNSSEKFKRTTDRAARSLIKLFHIDDVSWIQEMAKVEKIIEDLNKENASDDEHNATIGVKIATWVKKTKKPCKLCCCIAHCSLQSHRKNAKKFVASVQEKVTVEFDVIDNSWKTATEWEDYITNLPTIRSYDGLTNLLSSTNLDLEAGVDSDVFMSGHTAYNLP